MQRTCYAVLINENAWRTVFRLSMPKQYLVPRVELEVFGWESDKRGIVQANAGLHDLHAETVIVSSTAVRIETKFEYLQTLSP